MTIKELKELLNLFEEDMKITTIDIEGRFCEIKEVFEGYNIEGKVVVID